MRMTDSHEGLHTGEEIQGNDRLKSPCVSDPHLWWVPNALLFQFERIPVVDVITNVLFVSEDRAQRGIGPGAPRIGYDPFSVQDPDDLWLCLVLVQVHFVNP